MTIPCTDCNGTGTLDHSPANSPSQSRPYPCPSCDGTGNRRCEAWDLSLNHPAQCNHDAVILIDGEAFCAIHAPEYTNE